MSTPSTGAPRLGRLAFGMILMCVCLTNCGPPTEQASPTNILPLELPTGQLAFTFRRCERDDADIRLAILPDNDVTPILPDKRDDRMPVWSPDGQMLGVLSYGVNAQTLRVVDLSTPATHTELGGFVSQFVWSADGTSLFYLEREGGLYQYNLTTDESEKIIDGVSGFSVSPNGQWLGLSIRDPTQSGAFTFRVLDLSDNHLLTTVDQNDMGQLGSNRSVWSLATDEVAVLFGPTATQLSKVAIYTVQEDHLYVKAIVVARDTYRHDFGQDLISVEFSNLAWSPDGQRLLVIRSTTDTQPGGEGLLFDATLSDYQRLPFGENITNVTWKKDGRWLAYVMPSNGKNNSGCCSDRFRGEIWLANMETLKTQVLVTSTLTIYQPSWRPH